MGGNGNGKGSAQRPIPVVRAPVTALIRVQLVRAPGWISHAIAWWGSGWDGYSHADFMLPDGSLLGARSDRIKVRRDGQKKVYPPGVQVRCPDYERWERRTLYTLEVRPEVAAAVYSSAEAKVGTAYDRDGILRLIRGEEPHADGRYFCSCLVVTVLQERGVLNQLPMAPQQITPDCLGNVLAADDFKMRELPC